MEIPALNDNEWEISCIFLLKELKDKSLLAKDLVFTNLFKLNALAAADQRGWIVTDENNLWSLTETGREHLANTPEVPCLADKYKTQRTPRKPYCHQKQRKLRTYELDGRSQNIFEWAKEFNLPYLNVRKRINRLIRLKLPCTVEAVASNERIKSGTAITIGNQTKYLTEWLLCSHTARKTYDDRKHRLGWSDAEALGLKLLTHGGETYTSNQWREKLGIKKRTYNQRISKGWTIEQALEFEPV